MNMPHFIGRETDLNQIDEHFLHVMTSQSRVLLIEGIAGIGKSRLAEQIEARSELNGMRIAVGRCYEDITQPYTPFRALLKYFEEEELLDDHGNSYLHVLTGHRLPASNVSSAPDANPDMLLFMNLTQAILMLAARAPLVFIVEDLHWADASTLDVFDYLAFALAEQGSVPLLLIGTHRPVAPATRLGKLLARLSPEPLVRSLTLSGLDDVETRDLLRALGVRRPTQQLVQAVHEATQGVPLFVEEALRHLVRQGALYEQGGALSIRTGSLPSIEFPSDLTNAISGRLRSLPLTCQFSLTLAALLGETFQTDVLQMLVTQSPEELAQAIEDGIEHGVLIREDTHMRFAHPLLRHAFYNRLATLARQTYHLQIAQTFETLYADNPEPHILDMAYHVVMAGSLAAPDMVFNVTQRAADRAFGIFAWHEAARYYEAALMASETVTALSAQERADLGALGDSYAFNFRF
ncbi:ATP-binding protein [Candidatus Entotheonella palauensis]|nr:AAA family ATPase [Candidatus Entotheonella palauensis]